MATLATYHVQNGDTSSPRSSGPTLRSTIPAVYLPVIIAEISCFFFMKLQHCRNPLSIPDLTTVKHLITSA